MSRLVALTTWMQDTYGADAPHIKTVLRWIRAGRIQPPPEKHGTRWYVEPVAVYTDRPRLSLVQRLAREKENRATA